MQTQVRCFVAAYLLCCMLHSHSASSRGECYFNGKARCEHNGRLFGIGESWLDDECFQCVCFEPFGVGCCEHGKKPIDFPDWCESLRKPGSCNIVVVMKSNRRLPCLFGWKKQLQHVAGPGGKSQNAPLF